MAAETGFMIEGEFYEIPTVSTLTLDEAEVLYQYADLAIEDFVSDPDDPDAEASLAQKMRRPGFKKALLHIAYQRKHPKLPASRVKQIVGATNFFDAFEQANPEAEDDADPPALTPGSWSDSDGSSASSGTDSDNVSDAQDDPAGTTGTTKSDTSSISALSSSAA